MIVRIVISIVISIEVCSIAIVVIFTVVAIIINFATDAVFADLLSFVPCRHISHWDWQSKQSIVPLSGPGKMP